MQSEKLDSFMDFLKARDIDYSKFMNMDRPFGDPIDTEYEDDEDCGNFLKRLEKYEVARHLEGEGVMTVDHAKYFIHNNFDLELSGSGKRGSNLICRGNIYESEAPNSIKYFIIL